MGGPEGWRGGFSRKGLAKSGGAGHFIKTRRWCHQGQSETNSHWVTQQCTALRGSGWKGVHSCELGARQQAEGPRSGPTLYSHVQVQCGVISNLPGSFRCLLGDVL